MTQPHRALAKSPALRRGSTVEAAETRSLDLPWQIEAYRLARDVGEAGFVMNLTANTVSMCGFPARHTAEDGTTSEVSDPRVQRVMAGFVGPRGGAKELKRRLALHASIAGEWHLIGTEHLDGPTNLGVVWEALSVRELRIDAKGAIMRSKDGGAAERLDPDTTFVARGWIADAELSNRADSQMRRALPVCREIARHTRAIDATSKSKAAAGILFVPEEMSFGPEDDADTVVLEGDEDVEAQADAFTEELLRHLSAPIEDVDSDAAYVPLVIRGPAEMADKIKMVQLERKLDTVSSEMLEKAILRLAKILDVPPEVLEGKGGLNHWTGFSVDADFLAKHVSPLGELLADFLTVAFLRPMLEEYENMPAEEAATYSIVFDLSPVSARADEEASARSLHDRDLLADATLVRASGFEDADMPDDEERRRRKIERWVQRVPALAPQLLPLLPEFAGIVFEPIAPAPAAGGEAQPEDRVVDVQSGAELPQRNAIVDRLAVAADAAIERAVERAAARVVTAGRRHPDLGKKLASTPKLDVFTVVGPADLTALGVRIDDLFADAWDQFAAKAQVWLRDAAVAQGMTFAAADDMAVLSAGALVDRLNQWTLGTLHVGASRGANGLLVPHDLVEDVVSFRAGALV